MPDTDMENSLKDDFQACRKYALYLLNLRVYTAHNFKKKLLEKEYSLESSEKVVRECIERGYLNDRLWSESFVRVQKGRKYGQAIIAQKLKIKGIEEGLIAEVLEKYRDTDGDQENIRTLLETRYRNRNLEDPREKQKVIASLLRRGFDYTSILKSL
ncbi:MAG: regulatory protein [Chlamydiales bacterium]|jgi:regulatory protein